MKPCYIIVLILLFSCKEKAQLTSNESGNNLVSHNQDGQAETFWSFHHRFLTDTGFQKSRRLDTSKTVKPDYIIAQAQYARLRDKSFSNGPAYDTVFIGYSLSVAGANVEEKVFNDGGIEISRRLFKRVNGKWYLDRYDDINWYPYRN
jgi:hypothetical protein